MWDALTAILAVTAAIPAEANLAAPANSGKLEFIRLDPSKILTIADDGKIATTSASNLGPEDQKQLERVKAAGAEAMGPKSITSALPAESAGIIRGQLSFQLLNVGKDSVLFIRNGLNKSIRYKLVMKTDNGVGPTDVCEVFTQRHSTEHWPYKIHWVAIGDLQRFDREGDDAPVCK